MIPEVLELTAHLPLPWCFELELAIPKLIEILNADPEAQNECSFLI